MAAIAALSQQEYVDRYHERPRRLTGESHVSPR
jgi:hypothetical protein